MGLICPKCSTETVCKLIGDVQIDYCSNGCKGIWFDEGELKKIKENASLVSDLENMDCNVSIKPKEEAVADKPIMCPRCNLEMFRYNWGVNSNIFIDSCDECSGIWFDAGELLAIKNYLANQNAQKESLDPNLIVKLDQIEEETNKKFEEIKKDNLNKLIDWDVLFFDDLLRFIVGRLT